jgi:hypothetical protein
MMNWSDYGQERRFRIVALEVNLDRIESFCQNMTSLSVEPLIRIF